MGEIDHSRTQHEAMHAVKARKAAGVERRLGALHSYLTALLYNDKRGVRQQAGNKDHKGEPG